jgi:hypothetical protein
VYRKLIVLAGVFLLMAVTRGLAQESAAETTAIPAATQSEMDCSGFIAGSPVSTDLYVLDGAGNDFRVAVHQFATGDFVYLRSRSGGSFAVGNEFSVVRPAKELMRVKWYEGQGASLHSLGTLYEDLGKVKVTSVTPHGAVAEVTFACRPIVPDDLVLPYRARVIPQFVPAAQFDRFALPNGKLVGAITAARDNAGALGRGSIAYVNLGREDGVSPGQRFRIFRIFREQIGEGFWARPETPRETLGELVILSTQERSSVAMVVSSTREIALGDGIELE